MPTAGSVKKICFTKSATQWTDENDNNKVYSFTCPADSVGTNGAMSSVAAMGASAALASLYLFA